MFKLVDTMVGFTMGQAARAAGNPLKKLDWDKLRNFVEEHKGEISDIFAGIKEDWHWTGDHVYSDKDGWIEPNMAYTESIWATPVALILWKPEYDGIDEFSDFILEENN